MFGVFSGGVHPPANKSTTEDKTIRRAKVPKKVILPLSQHTGKPSKAMVKPGDYVVAGAKVAQAEGFISANLHSPVSGKVLAIELAYHPILGKASSIIIESDPEWTNSICIRDGQFNLDGLSSEKIIEAVSEAGIVGAGGAAFPTHVKLSPPKGKTVEVLIINGSECEPYLTCDHRLMLERPDDIIKGAMLMCRALAVKKCIIGIEDNKPQAIEAVTSSGARNDAIRVIPLPTKYPQGAEKQLIKTLINKEVPSGGLPFDVGAVVQNVGTAAAVYEAVALNKPFYERVVTVSGDCVKEPANLLVKIGTPVKDLVEDCAGFIKEPAKVIFGGPMMGITQWTLEAPVLKGTSGVLFLSRGALQRAHALSDDESICIRCGGCVRVCPAGIVPTGIYYAAVKNMFDLADEYRALDCIECGCCSFECPAKLDLVGLIKYAKLMIRK